MLIAVISDLREIERARPFADLLEIRLDRLPKEQLSHLSFIPNALFTFRKKSQGGASDLPEEERLALLEKLLALNPVYCDLETDTDPAFLTRIGQKFPQIRFIGSYHNFDETPPDLEALFAHMRHPIFSLYKIAATARSTLDLLRLLELPKRHKNLCCIAMGEAGQASRVLGKIAGNALDYASLTPEYHQIGLQELHELYHYPQLNAHTAIYALLGNPISQSPGPLYHNQKFASRNAVYVKLLLTAEELPSFFHSSLPFAGFSITIPLKEAILPWIDVLDPDAQTIGAVNTVVLRNGKRYGFNTDGQGALNAIEKKGKVRGKSVAILGAGGTARSIAYEAKRRGASVAVFNRTVERAEELARALQIEGFPLEALPHYPYEILINTTPGFPIPESHFRPHTLAMDVVYHPKETPFLQAAHRKECICVYGEEMFLEQAALQNKIFLDLV